MLEINKNDICCEERLSYIYKVTNLFNGMSYIGQTVEPMVRVKTHLISKDNEYFHRSIRKHGIDNFEWEILMSGPESTIDDVEIGCIVLENTKVPLGYNENDGGPGNHGMKCSEETKQKMRLAKLGKKQPIEQCRKRGDTLRGRVRSDDVKAKISAAKLGRPCSEETKIKISKKLSGRKMSEEWIAKQRSKVLSEEHRRKISESLKRRSKATIVII
jgi:group I intron endonuclease